MTIINFPSPPLTLGETYTENNITYTWDGEKWTALPLTRDSMVPPQIQDITLTDTGVGGRFTSEVFTLAAQMIEDGDPASAKEVRIEITPEVLAEGSTDPISAVLNTQFADDIVMHPSSENSWVYMEWAGPPFNMYIACADGGSNTFKWVWSEDGETWTQFQGPKGASTAYGKNWAYRSNPADGTSFRIYVGSAGQNTIYNSISTREQLLNYENNEENWSTSRPHDNPSHRTDLQYDPVNDRLCAKRGPWDVSNTFVTYTPFPSALTDSGWRSCGGVGGAHIYRGIVLTNNVGNSYYCTRTSPHNEATYNSACVLDLQQANPSLVARQSTRDTQSYTGDPAYDPIHNRWFFSGWYWEGTDPTQMPSSISGWTSWTANIPTDGTTGRSYNKLFWSTQLQQLICVGGVRLDGTSGNQYCHWRSSDGGDTWTEAILTNPLTQERGNWSYAIDATQIGSHLLCSNGGNVAGKRFGKSTTLGSNETFPQLFFESTAGLDAFSVGQAVEQEDGNATGNIAALNTDDGWMIVSNTTGTWAVGQRVQSNIGSYDRAFAVINGVGTVAQLSPGDPGWTRLDDATGPWNITFPATFANTGNAPDDDIPAGGTIVAQVRAVSEQNGFTAISQLNSDPITPT